MISIDFFLPYIELAKPIVGTTLDIRMRLSNCKSETKKHQVYGSITKSEKKGLYTIFMYLNAQRCNPKGFESFRAFTPIELLCTLAHELAHIKHWYHTPSHKMLENHLCTIFMQQLRSDGYISEEKDKEWEA